MENGTMMSEQAGRIERHAGCGAWRDEGHTPWMINLPLGEFIMGETSDDKFANDTERPAHRVEIGRPVAIAAFPVTAEQFRAFRPDHAPKDASDLPVVEVAWNDAQSYCAWLSATTGRRYRLPSESEWEYACRAGSSRPFATGDEITPEDANFLYDEYGQRIGPGVRTPAGAYSPNAFGLRDLHGNVCEWVEDTWHPNYAGAPDDGSPWIEGGAADRRVIRGGAWDYLPRLLRSAWRDWFGADLRRDNIGFRVACASPPLPT
jgi:formylglycine-generating enzyme required for sulfatase activity